MRLGFVGVGKWAQKLATAFRACGAEIVCHDRRTPGVGQPPGTPVGKENYFADLPGFGEYQPWGAQIRQPDLDAIVAVAPPGVTTEVALACAAAGKPVMATKPLFDHPKTILAPFYVDFWRLWSDAHVRAAQLSKFVMRMTSAGPIRSFPGSLDWGPHIMASALALGFSEVVSAENIDDVSPGGEGFLVKLRNPSDGRDGMALFGTGFTDTQRNLGRYDETATHIGSEPKDQILQRFCQSFLNDVSEGFVDTRLLNLSRDGTRELRRIREMATASDPKPRSEP